MTLLLGGCAQLATRPPPVDGLTFAQREARLAAIPAWQMRGRLAVDTGSRGFQGGYSWTQDGKNLNLTVRGPLGAGVLEVSGSPTALTVNMRGTTRVLERPEADLSRLLGWWMPVESLPHWLLGLPDPGYRATRESGAGNTLATLDQRQWHITYAAYQLADGVLVPSKIKMQHGPLHFTLTIDRFAPQEPDTQQD